MIYGETYTVRWHDTDDENEVRPARMLEYMQETCNPAVPRRGAPAQRDAQGRPHGLSAQPDCLVF